MRRLTPLLPGVGASCPTRRRALTLDESIVQGVLGWSLRCTIALLRGPRSMRYAVYNRRESVRPSTVCRLQKVKCSPYSITERRVPELIPVLGSQPAGDVSHIPGGRLPLFSARPAVTPATLKTAATSFAAW